MRAGQFLKAWSRTFPILCLSSGESELAAVVKASAEGLGIVALLKDFGMDPTLEIQSDATAAIGMCRRLGLGKVRHLSVADLWVQQRVRKRDLFLTKVAGSKNPSDAMTKPKSQGEMDRFMNMLGFRRATGRSKIAPIRSKQVIEALGKGVSDMVDEGVSDSE